MRNIIFLMHVSLDGFVAGPNGEMDWIAYGDDLQEYVYTLHATTDAAIYGRVTYEMMQGYWPTLLSDPDSPEVAHARWYDNATKIVISRTLENDEALKRHVIGENIAEEINKIKQQPGKDIWLLGSPSTAQEFMRLDLIDEYRINVNPVVLGHGKRLFEGVADLKLNLLEAKPFKDGEIVLRYEPVRS
jgi:dihydrofolate reductase